MRRRSLMKVGLAAGALLAVAGAGLALVQPARRDGKLTETGRALFTALAPAVLAGLLPAAGGARQQAVVDLLGRIEVAIVGMPPAMQAEVDELLTIAGNSVGRLALVGLGSAWGTAGSDEVQSALRGMRDSSLALRQQAYHALRDLTNGGYFADEATWAVLGYPGQRPV
ncbi:MAG: hypothetical protein JNK55_12595 [Rubrivivax sp.]|nr:hypothetical protein [Rubrivivax sp.]